MASANSVVPAVPPTSRVRCFFSPKTFSSASANVVGGVLFAEVAQHQNAGAQHRRRVGDVLACNVGRRAVYGFEDGALVAEVRARHQAQPPTKPAHRSEMMSP